MLGLDVTPADVQDRDGFLALLKRVRRVFVFLERLFADGAYSGTETVYRPQFLRHRIEAYAASAAIISCLCRTPFGVWKPCRAISQVEL